MKSVRFPFKEVVVAVISFVLGSVYIYLQQKEQIQNLLFSSRELYEFQRSASANQRDAFLVLGDCMKNLEICDQDSLVVKLQSLIDEHQKINSEIERSSRDIEKIIKANGWLNYESNN